MKGVWPLLGRCEGRSGFAELITMEVEGISLATRHYGQSRQNPYMSVNIGGQHLNSSYSENVRLLTGFPKSIHKTICLHIYGLIEYILQTLLATECCAMGILALSAPLVSVLQLVLQCTRCTSAL